MGFFSGSLTCTRFSIIGGSPTGFSALHLEALDANAIGKQRIVRADGSKCGWGAGEHILDNAFDIEKNIINDTLHFALRVDSQQIPGDLLRAYVLVELKALAANNPSGHPSAKQKREARQVARERLEQEAADGRFIKRKSVPVLWDCQANELLIATTSLPVIYRVQFLFKETFGRDLQMLSAGRKAFSSAEVRDQTAAIDNAKPAPFASGPALTELSWLPDETNRDFLGNEFLLWLWYYLENVSDSIITSDSEVTAMVARTLALECPRSQNGKDTISSDGPTRLPESYRAIQAGKLPRKAGLMLVRHDQPYQLTLQAETMAISGAKLPALMGESERARQEERIDQIRHLLETLDLLYDAFIVRRCGGGWGKELESMRGWLRGEMAKKATA